MLFKAVRKEGKNMIENLKVYLGDWDSRDVAGQLGGRNQLRVAFYECNIGATGELACIGSQTRNREY
jgi:hypothetical protein